MTNNKAIVDRLTGDLKDMLKNPQLFGYPNDRNVTIALNYLSSVLKWEQAGKVEKANRVLDKAIEIIRWWSL